MRERIDQSADTDNSDEMELSLVGWRWLCAPSSIVTISCVRRVVRPEEDERGSLWPGQAMSLQVKQVLHHSKSLYQDILVFESTHLYGNILVLVDGVMQVTTERDEFLYNI
ncbi:hypothetical protein ACA910_009819 [Epithemia clementina (nom. ined.)]